MKENLYYVLDYNKLERILREKKISIAELSRRLNVSYRTLYSKIFRRAINIDLPTVVAIMKVLRITDINEIIIPYSEVEYYYIDEIEE